jgi:hypothetical protein
VGARHAGDFIQSDWSSLNTHHAYDATMDYIAGGYVEFDPAQVRSLFARFDPSKANSPRLMD